MQAVNKVRIEVAGNRYTITSAEEPEYVEGLARQLDQRLKKLLESSPALSVNDALIR